MKFTQVKFSKKQREVLRQMFLNANKAFIDNVKNDPNLYNESNRDTYVYGYVESFIEQLDESGFAFLEE